MATITFKSKTNFDTLDVKIQEHYRPGKHIFVNEGMIGFKGRLSFCQYMQQVVTKLVQNTFKYLS